MFRKLADEGRVAMIIAIAIGLASSLSLTMTAFAWGTGQETIFFMLFSPLFLFTLVIVMIKVRFSYQFALLFSVCYAILLTRDIGEFLVFRLANTTLIWVLLLPYIACLSIIIFATCLLTKKFRYSKSIIAATILMVCSLPIISIAERWDMAYSDSIYMDFEIQENGNLKIEGRPGFADSRHFRVSMHSDSLTKAVMAYGEFFHGSYVVTDVKIKKNYRFSDFRTLSIESLGQHKLDFKVSWTSDELEGDTSFLQP